MFRAFGLTLAVCAMSACGSTATADGGLDGGGGGAGGGGAGGGGGGSGGAGQTVASTGTIGGQTAALVSGYARLDTGGALLIFSSLNPFTCPTTSGYQRKANEASADIMITVADGGSLVGTFPFRSTASAGGALGFVVRAPATCPTFIGDGTAITGGSITINGNTGGLQGTFGAQIAGGEQLSVQFDLPYCAIAGISGTCQP